MRRALIATALAVTATCTSSHKHATRPSPSISSSSTTTTSTSVPPTTAPDQCNVPRRAAPAPDRPVYTVSVAVRPSEQRAYGDVAVRFRPDIATDRLVFRVWANAPRITTGGGHESVADVLVDGRRATPSMPDPTTVIVPLGRTLAAGQHVAVTLRYELGLPGAINDRIAQIGDNVRLGSFFPILAWEPGIGWATEPATNAFAEASTAPTADFDLHVDAPDDLDVLASGTPDASHRQWRAAAVRDVALTVGHFRIASLDQDGVHITVGASSDVRDDPAVYLRKIAQRLALFNHLFGAYPWPTYTVALTPNLTGGIEYPSHVMQGPNTIGRTTTHELGHQWFYGLVGDDQARDPWLDEGLASYAEARGEGTLTTFNTLPIPADVRNRTGEPMTFWAEHQPSYYRGVYVQGARAMASLGPVDRVDCALRVYVARNAYRIATDHDLIAAMTEVFGDRARARLATFGIASGP